MVVTFYLLEMIKKLFKKLLSSAGYSLLSNRNLQTIKEGKYIPDIDFYYLINKCFKSNAPVCCFDIGANKGQTSLKLNKYFPKSTIHSFEPILITYKELELNTEDHKSIFPHNIALGDTIGELEIYRRENSEWNSLNYELNVNAKREGGESEIIKVDTIDNFLNQNGILKVNFLKSDTEGFEMSVLKGAIKSLENESIEMMYVEVGFDYLDKQHTHFNEVFSFINNFSYSFCGLFESSYGQDLKLYYSNALFISKQKLAQNTKEKMLSVTFPAKFLP